MLRVGDKVRKNPTTWMPSEFDAWGRGEGVGIVVEPPFAMDFNVEVDVRWPNGRCFELAAGLIKVDDHR